MKYARQPINNYILKFSLHRDKLFTYIYDLFEIPAAMRIIVKFFFFVTYK